MAHEVFVSYSSNDKEIVDAICAALDEQAISCWYAPRDIPLGATWDSAIMEALGASRVMVLVWSSHSDESKQVKREVALALDETDVTVIPFRLESIEPSKLRFFLNGIQWFDASTPPLEANLKLLVEKVKIAIPIVGQIPASPEEQRKRSVAPVAELAPECVCTTTTQPPEVEASGEVEERLLDEAEAIQKDEAEAIEEAEAEAFRYFDARSRLLTEVAALKRAAAETQTQMEARVLKEAELNAVRRAEAEAVQYAESKARAVAEVESLRRKVFLKRAEVAAARSRRHA